MMDQIGRYKIIGELGRGAMGVVYHATDPSIGRSVAIKTIRIRDISDTKDREKLRERLFREARSAGVLSHPKSSPFTTWTRWRPRLHRDGLVNGPTLEKILASDTAFGRQMLRILRQAASALDYAKPRNRSPRCQTGQHHDREDGVGENHRFGIAKLTAGASPPRPNPSPAPRTTCRPSRYGDCRWTAVRTSFPWPSLPTRS